MAFRKIARTKLVRLARVAVGASALAAMAIPVSFVTSAEAKTPGKTYCYYGKCHRVKTIEETRELVGKEEAVTASHYDDCSRDRYNPCGLTSSGERFHPDRPDNTASPIYPDGTTLLVWSPNSGRALVVRVNNAGPYWGNRTLDLSKAAAEKLGFAGEGVADLRLKVIKEPAPEEAVYSENRTYAPVPGDIGQYASLADADRGTAVALAFQAASGSPLAPVTTANAFAGAGSGSGGMLVAEAPQVFGRAQTVAYTPSDTQSSSVAFGGFPQSHAPLAALGVNSPTNPRNQTAWNGETIDEPAAVPPQLENSTVALDLKPVVEKKAEVEKAEVEKAAVQKVAAADDEDAKPSKKRVARKDDDDEDQGARRSRSRNKVARSERSRGNREEREYSRARVASAEERSEPRYVSSSYGDGGSRSAQQTTYDNMRPL
jgi:rare lipoprotein A (peptidoglycan hydrolase)